MTGDDSHASRVARQLAMADGDGADHADANDNEGRGVLDVSQGLLIQLDGRWHHSVEYDGHVHECACGREASDAPWTIRRPPDDPDGPRCSECFPEPVTDGVLVPVCPECDGARIQRRTPGKNPGHDTTRDWWCPGCDATFDEPAERRVQPRHRKLAPAGKVLADADPDDLLTDGSGRPPADGRRADPADDSRACSLCGVHIGIFGDEYCDGCARELGAKPPLQRCEHCGTTAPEPHMESFDVSTESEYYPDIRYLCPSCQGGDGA